MYERFNFQTLTAMLTSERNTVWSKKRQRSFKMRHVRWVQFKNYILNKIDSVNI